MKKEKMLSYSDLPNIIKSHPLGLIVAFMVLGVLLIYSGVLGCALKEILFTLLNKSLPNCNSDNILKVKLGEWLINLFQYEWFIWFILILGAIIYFKFKKK